MHYTPPLNRRFATEVVLRNIEGELATFYGHTGHIALYRFVIARDEVGILAPRRFAATPS